MLIYKVFRVREWNALAGTGETVGAPIDRSDGFIHFSTAEQLRETVAKHFADIPGLVLAAVDTESLGDDLKWEVSRGGDKFPHLYRKLKLSEVVHHAPLKELDGVHLFPDEIP
ncbi:DUF952 domain-containing protein [Halocynthiibacter sp. C4]|uniref:DUF952 domain-containing protein n=1 Tax=Halocynthiibacter sp. C4 TaxID=2992758 RepID=UPI00237C3ACE|nr:DUF952 domain-containing protein [Halocynthiibacter sp. C4]MDE0588793.1 DUF952 domain-containing protein [Halocynthiibacter sp. C4]